MRPATSPALWAYVKSLNPVAWQRFRSCANLGLEGHRNRPHLDYLASSAVPPQAEKGPPSPPFTP